MEVAALQKDLLAWFDEEARDLPWRGVEDPYAVWVSEVMLQQTQVDTVIPYYAAWMKRFPDVHALAAADEDDVMATWEGLGYYRRVRALHAAAKIIARHGMPDDAAGWKALPGIGDYTAAAIASMAHGQAIAAVDGNVQRVVARLMDLDADVTTAAGRRAIAVHAQRILDPDRPGDWNEAMMDLGATICRPAAKCEACPLSLHCRALANLSVDQRPRRPARKPAKTEQVHFGMVMSDGRVLLVKRPDDGLLAGTWGLPGGSTDTPLAKHIERQAALQVQVSQTAARAKHVFTHRVWDMHIHQCHILDVPPDEPGLPVRWVPLNRLEAVGMSAAMRKALGAAGLTIL